MAIGTNGDDRIVGSTEGEPLIGLRGNDTYLVTQFQQKIVELPGEGTDTVLVTGTLAYALDPDAEVEFLALNNPGFSTLRFGLTGNGYGQLITGGAGENELRDGGGRATLQGLAGNDYYVVSNSLTVVSEAAGAGSDVIYTYVDYVIPTSSEVEAMQAIDTTGFDPLRLTGNAYSQLIIGNQGANLLNGLGGADTLAGAGGNDTYLVRSQADIVIEGPGLGSDTVFATASYALGDAEVEILSTVNNSDTTPINLIGNFATQTIVGNYGSNVLNGGSGGNDTLIGLRGDDIYAVGSQSVVIVENGGEGIDTVVANVSYTLGAGVSVEVLAAQNRSSTEALSLKGNELAQTVAGNEGANTIDGGGGNDVLIGGGGADRFAFTTALGPNNVDAIADFQLGVDKIGLAQGIFGMAGVTAANFTTGAATTADQHIIYNQATGQLFYDADGNGSGAAVLFAVVMPNTALTATSFEVIGG